MTRLVPPLALVLLATAAAAEVRVHKGPDGVLRMVNDGPAPRRAAPLARRPPPAELTRLIESHARRRNLDARLVQAVVQVESGYDRFALSRKGAMGLMQLMPPTAHELEVRDPYDPDENLRGGADYLRSMLDRFGNRLELALASYNAGPEAVERYGGVPPYEETRRFVDSVLELYRGEKPFGTAGGIIRGRKTFLLKDSAGRILLTTTPPARR